MYKIEEAIPDVSAYFRTVKYLFSITEENFYAFCILTVQKLPAKSMGITVKGEKDIRQPRYCMPVT